MMKLLLTLYCLALAGTASAFQAVRPQSPGLARISSSTTALNVFGNKKSAAQKKKEEEEASKYWQGEWVCKDCGYIYNRVSFLY